MGWLSEARARSEEWKRHRDARASRNAGFVQASSWACAADLPRALDLIEELRVAAQRMLALPAAFDHAITEEEWLGMARALLSRIEGEQ